MVECVLIGEKFTTRLKVVCDTQVMNYSPCVDGAETLRTKVSKCRSLADQASDAEVAQALRDIADDMEAAIAIIEEHAKRGD